MCVDPFISCRPEGSPPTRRPPLALSLGEVRLRRLVTHGTLGTLGVRALGLNMAWLLALVADLLTAARVLGAVAREMARLATVVALAAINAIAWKKVRFSHR
jgi:hypothetical protein